MEGTGTSTRVLSFSSRAALGAGTSFSAMRFAPFVARHTNDRASPMSRCAMWSALPRSASQRHARSYTHIFTCAAHPSTRIQVTAVGAVTVTRNARPRPL